jgi:hypothetical protein
MAKAKLGSGKRFAALVESIKARDGADDPKAVAAAAGRKKYGKSKMALWAARARKRKAARA